MKKYIVPAIAVIGLLWMAFPYVYAGLFGSTAGARVYTDVMLSLFGWAVLLGPAALILGLWFLRKRENNKDMVSPAAGVSYSMASARAQVKPAGDPVKPAKYSLWIGLTVILVIGGFVAIYYYLIQSMTPDSNYLMFNNTEFFARGAALGVAALSLWGVWEAVRSLRIRRGNLAFLGLILCTSLLWLAVPASLWLRGYHARQVTALAGQPTTYETEKHSLEEDLAATDMHQKVMGIDYDIFLPTAAGVTLYDEVPGDMLPLIVHPKGQRQHMTVRFNLGGGEESGGLNMFKYDETVKLEGEKTTSCVNSDNNFDKSLMRGVCYRIGKTGKGVTVYGDDPDYLGRRNGYAFVIGNTYIFGGSRNWQDKDAFAFIDSLKPVSKEAFIEMYKITPGQASPLR